MPINLFVKFDELEEIPQIKTVFVDGVQTCISGEVKRPQDVQSSSSFPTEPPKTKGIRLNDLPFESFPSVTLIPPQVNNVSS